MASAEARVKLGDIRHQAIQLRRYLSPQREALFRLQIEEMSWLEKRDKIHLREVTDKVLRYVEDLDAIRDRATILHEDLTAIVSEQISKTSNRLTLVAATILPPSLFVGLLGSNVEGIPGHDHPVCVRVRRLDCGRDVRGRDLALTEAEMALGGAQGPSRNSTVPFSIRPSTKSVTTIPTAGSGSISSTVRAM